MPVGVNPISSFIKRDELAPEVSASPVITDTAAIGIECTPHELALIVEGIGQAIDSRLPGCIVECCRVEVVFMRALTVILDSLPS